MKPIVRSFGVSVLLLATAIHPLLGASVGPAGHTNSFDSKPRFADWSSRPFPGSAADVYNPAVFLQSIAPSAINQTVVDGSPSDPPSTNNNAIWTSANGGYLCTRPAGFRCVVVQAKLVNNTGTNATSLRISYDFDIKGGPPEADNPGLRAFFNVTGLTNGWVPIPELSSTNPAAGTLAADLTLTTPWTEGTNLYVAWIDDNANMEGSDPAYTLDNFFVAVTAGTSQRPPLSVTLTSPTNNARFFAPSMIPIVAVTPPPLSISKVAFFADGAKLGDLTAAPYTFEWTNPPVGRHTLTAIATDDTGSNAQSAPITIAVHDADGSPLVQITAPTDGLIAEGPTNLLVTALVSTPGAVTNVAFLTNDVLAANDRVSPYSIAWNTPFGAVALTAIATDTNGLRGTSAVVNVVITYPPTNTVAPVLVAHAPLSDVTISNLGGIQVTFSEYVVNVTASDLLLNGAPAAAVSGDGTNYVFLVDPPPSGLVTVTWATNHGITDVGWPAALAFDSTTSNATWSFNFVNLNLQAAVVGPGGYANTFATRPMTTDWATVSRGGGGGDNYDMDADVNATMNAANITNRTVSDSGEPPTANVLATWSSAGAFLQTRPTGNRFTALLARFLNNTGTNATEISLSYLLTIGGTAANEDTGRGTHVYFSLTGETNSWSPLATLNTTASAGSFPLSTNLALNWTNEGRLYLLWADDNANAGTDVANEIDDFALKVTAGAPPAFLSRVTTPVPDELFVSGGPIVATAIAAHGIPPYTVQYFTNNGAGNASFAPAGSSTNAPYEVSLGLLPAGTYNIYAVATDSAGTPVSTNSLTNMFFIADPMILTLTSPVDGATFDNTTSVSAGATVIGGTAPYAVQFYLDDQPFGEPDSVAPYQLQFGPLFVGDHAIRAVATDATGWVSNSVTHAVQITGPVAVMLIPTNGAAFNHGHSLVLTAVTGGGTGPYAVTFTVNGQTYNASPTPPFTVDLGVLPVGTYACSAQVTDSSSPIQRAESITNLITIVENPLVATLTSPTSGQNVPNTMAYSVTATAGVAAPLTVSKVDFYYDDALLGSDSTAPYSALVTDRILGSHTVYAVATDSLGRTAYTFTNQMNFIFDPLANDNFTNRFPLVGAVTGVTASNVGATTETGEPTGSGFTVWGTTLWWSWVAPAAGRVVINTTGSSFNIGQGVYTGTAVNALTQVAFAGNSFGGTVNQVSFTAVQGTEYQIQIAGMRGFGSGATAASGSIVFSVQMPPTVAITSPSNNSTFIAASNIFITATATSVLGTVKQVDFYAVNATATLLGSVTNAPYDFTATNVPLGTNTLYAVVTDSAGQMATSSGVPILVLNSGLTLVLPADGATFGTTNPITVNAIGAPPTGTITNVEFFVNGQKFSEDDTVPFSVRWTNVVGGSHRLTATGRSDAGDAYNSQPVNIAVSQTLLASNSVWKYLDNGYDQGTNWITTDFDDSSWASGPAPLGFSDSNGRLPLTTNSFGPDANNKYPTTYYRQAVVISNLSKYATFTLNIQRDDGAVVYLNGVEAGRFNMPTGPIAYTNYAAANASDDGATTISISLDRTLLREGTNVFAVEIHQDSATSSDIWFVMELLGVPPIIRNQYPIVALTSPTNGANFFAPATVSLSAEATDPDGQIAMVEFLVDGVKVGESTVAPYNVIWNNPPVAAHVLTAVATDNQGGITTSAPVPIVVYDAAGTPVAAITSPPDGMVVEGPTNLLVMATANAIAGVTNVMFLDNDEVIGSDDTAPYSINWNAPFLIRQLTAVAFDANGVRGTSPVVQVTITIPPTNTIAPTIARQNPPADSTITNLTSIQVTFSQRVVGVDASDLLVNGVAATNVVGSGSNYVFAFPHPPYGLVQVTWSSNSAIHDLSWPVNLPFYDNNPDNYWTYDLIDRTSPTIVTRSPAAGATLTNLTQINVTFSEAVAGVDATDLLINGVPAYDVEGHDAVYAFAVSQPASGTVNATWATNHAIVDLAPAQNPFLATGPGATWTYTLDAKTVLIQSNSYWFFVKGINEASSPTNAWRMLGFDDAGWSNSPAPFFYGDPYSNGVPAYTLLDDMRSNYTSVYLRKTLVVPNASGITNLFLRAQIDDGMIVWINGVEVLRTNVPAGDLPYSGTASSASQDQNGAPYLNYALLDPRNYLVSGTNVIAVHAFNESLSTSSDFGFNAQLYTYQANTEAVAPQVARKDPEPGYVLSLTNLTVTFSEPVTNVEAADLLINGVAATALTSPSNTVYTFHFPQPAFGAVSIGWTTNHGIVDLDIEPKPFNAGLPGANWGYVLLNANSPYLIAVNPVASTTVTGLTQIALTFSEPITGLDAADLLLNGVPATGLTGTETNFTFSFPPPAYGIVYVTWATNHGIQDLSQPPDFFDPLWPSHNWTYTLVDRIPPTITEVSPSPATLVLNLTQLTMSFSEPVVGVNASDLLINGQPAASVTGSNATFTFTFRQPNASLINVTWAANHGIRDLATVPNPFDATAAGATWSYPTVDNLPPTLSSILPLPGSSVRSLRRLVLSFDEPVQGVDTSVLTINGAMPTQVSGSAAGPYTFEFDQPTTGAVQIALSPLIWDLALAVNQFPGSNWTYVLNPNLPPPTITRGPYLQQQTTNGIIVRWRTQTATDSSVQYGLDPDSRTNTVNDAALTTEHVITLTNLTLDTRYEYAIGTTDGGLVVDTNFYFRTAPPIGSSGPTRVWFISDYGFKDSGEASVRDSYFNYVAPVKPADVWITGGDNDQTDGTDANDQIAVFGTTYAYGNLLRNTPIWPTIGNHDYMTGQGTPYYANFSLPTNSEAGGVPSGTEHYYSFDYNNIHFISLDSIVGTLSASANTVMTDWLRQDLAATTQRWIIAYWHGGPYTKSSHDSDSTTDTLAWMVQMRENIVPILESYGVDLVLNGHSHAYERSWPINGHYGFSTTFSETNKLDAGDGRVDGTGAYLKSLRGPGTIYVTAAVGGQLQNRMSVQHPAHLLKISDALGSLVIDVEGDRLDLQFMNTSGVALDHFTISKAAQTLAGVPTGLTATRLTNNQVRLTWNNSATNEMGYVIERSSDGRAFSEIAAVAANATQYLDASVPATGSWVYRISSWNMVGRSTSSTLAAIGAQPALSIASAGGAIIISWPASLAGQLQSSSTMAPGAAWETVVEQPVIVGALKVCTIPLTPEKPVRFFRLDPAAQDAEPTLTVGKSGDTIVVSWPASAEGYELESSTTLGSAATWQPVTEGITTVGNLRACTVSPNAANPARYFRLRKP